jgi:molybdopterin-guanine dinucleotide biosynthesis protein B
MRNAQVPILGFVAASGTGKTTLLTQLIPLLKAKGFRIGLIKHSHHAFEIDYPGKDSFRLRAAGATTVMLVSAYSRAVITEFTSPEELELDQQLAYLPQSDLDLILVEGFKTARFPKIELHRLALTPPLLYKDDWDIIAVASDGEISLTRDITRLDLNNPLMIADYIETIFLTSRL